MKNRNGFAATFTFFVVVTSVCTGLLVGCVSEGNSSRPDVSFSVLVNSLPPGASVYAANSDGTLGALIGTTPYQWRLGVSVSPMGPNSGFAKNYLWGGPGIAWGTKKTSMGGTDSTLILLNISLIEDGYLQAWVTNKAVADLFEEYPPRDLSITIPLQALSNGSGASQQQQQQQQQQQTIIINNN